MGIIKIKNAAKKIGNKAIGKADKLVGGKGKIIKVSNKVGDLKRKVFKFDGVDEESFDGFDEENFSSLNINIGGKLGKTLSDKSNPAVKEAAAMNIVKSPAIASKMQKYITLHGINPLDTPLKKAAQVLSIRKKYEQMYRDKKRRAFVGSEFDFDRAFNSPEGQAKMEEFIDQEEAALGFFGFDSTDDGEQMQHILPLVALAGAKKLLPVIKKVGGKVLKAAKGIKGKAQAAQDINEDVQLKAAQVAAMNAGVPPQVISKALTESGISTKDLKNIAGVIIQKDAANARKIIEEITKTFIAADINKSEDQKAMRKDLIMYAGGALILGLILFLIFRR